MAELTPLSALGEFGLIDRIRNNARQANSSTILGIGDDAAVLAPDNKEVVISTDLLAEGVHFDLTFAPLKHLGYKSVAVNVSDIVAMCAVPTQVVISLAIPGRFSVEAIEEFYEGVRAACEQYGVDLVGGDTTSSRSGLVVSVTAIGLVEKGAAVLRSGAQEHDLICVTGDLGAAYLGLQVLSREKAAFEADPDMQPELSGYEYVLQRQLRPEARLEVSRLLREHGISPTSMIDISDGLASELRHLSKASGLGADIYADKLPLDHRTLAVGEEFRIDPLTCALHGGEDYELLFTVRQQDYEAITSINEVSVIGHMRSTGTTLDLITKGGTRVNISPEGWQHF
jgi:thiamine-monophosphate kinase